MCVCVCVLQIVTGSLNYTLFSSDIASIFQERLRVNLSLDPVAGDQVRSINVRILRDLFGLGN